MTRRESVRYSQWVASVVLGFACLTSMTALAQAQPVFVLPPQGDERLLDAREKAVQSLGKALESQGLRFVRYEQLRMTLPQDDERFACDSIDCAGVWLRTTDAELAAAVAVWSGSDSSRPESVYVTLLDTQGARYPGEARIENGDVGAATEAALLQARSRQLLGPGPWVEIEGEPPGADVYIDGTLVGTLPYHASLGAGRHTLRIEAEGHGMYEQTLDMPIKQSQEVEVDVRLPPEQEQAATPPASAATATASRPPDTTRTETRYPILGPALLGGAGILAITASTIALDRSDCEVRAPEGDCRVGTEVNAAPVALVGAGGVAAVVGALVWFFAGAEEIPASDEHAGIELDVGPGTLELEGRF